MSVLQDVHESVWVAPSALLSGRITIAEGASVWHNVVMRAECEQIRIGRMTNVQDFVMIHIGYESPTLIGEFCSVAHHATIHGCTLGDHTLVGPNALIMDGAVVGAGSIVAGGSVIPEGKEYPPGSIIAGVPGRAVAQRDNARANRLNAWQYHRNAACTRAGDERAWEGADYQAWLAATKALVEADRDL